MSAPNWERYGRLRWVNGAYELSPHGTDFRGYNEDDILRAAQEAATFMRRNVVVLDLGGKLHHVKPEKA